MPVSPPAEVHAGSFERSYITEPRECRLSCCTRIHAALDELARTQLDVER